MEVLQTWVKSMEKKAIRKQTFALRRLHSKEWIDQTSEKICDQILASKEYRCSMEIWAYMDCKGEVSMKKLLQESWRQGKRVAVPKVIGEELKFYLINSCHDVAPGYFQVPEPTTNIEATEETALIIVPGVAFDANRHRCGYGKGFYDRYLAAHPGHCTIAAAFDFQLVEHVPIDAYDVIPGKLITETQIYQG